MSRSKIPAIAVVLALAVQVHAQNRSVELIKTLSGHTKSILQIAFSPRDEIVAASSKDGTVRLWSVASGQSLGTIVAQRNAEPEKLSWTDCREPALPLLCL